MPQYDKYLIHVRDIIANHRPRFLQIISRKHLPCKEFMCTWWLQCTEACVVANTSLSALGSPSAHFTLGSPSAHFTWEAWKHDTIWGNRVLFVIFPVFILFYGNCGFYGDSIFCELYGITGFMDITGFADFTDSFSAFTVSRGDVAINQWPGQM